MPDKENTVSDKDKPINIGATLDVKRPAHETLSVNDRIDVLEFRRTNHEDYVNIPFNIGLYLGAQRKSNLESRRQINQRWDDERHAILDENHIPRLASELTQAEIADLNRPNRKLRNSSLSGSWYGPLFEDDNLTLKERIDLAMCGGFGMYMTGISEPNEVLDPRAHEMWIIDVTCAMDNARVPRLRSEMTDEQKKTLEELRKPPKFADYLDLIKPARADFDPKLYEAVRDLMVADTRTYPRFKFGPPSNSNPRSFGDLDSYSYFPDRPPPPSMRAFDEGLFLHVEKSWAGPPVTLHRGKSREEGFRRGEFIIDPAFIWPSQQNKVAFTTSFLDLYPSRRSFPKIDYMDSLKMFQAKMRNRPRQGKRVGLWLIEQAYDLTRRSASGFTSFVNPRQTGKRTMSLAFYYAAMGYGDMRNWPKTSCGFFLHAAYDLQPADHQRFYPYSHIDELIERVREDLFYNIPRVDYDKPARSNSSSSTSRNPYRPFGHRE